MNATPTFTLFANFSIFFFSKKFHESYSFLNYCTRTRWIRKMNRKTQKKIVKICLEDKTELHRWKQYVYTHESYCDDSLPQYVATNTPMLLASWSHLCAFHSIFRYFFNGFRIMHVKINWAKWKTNLFVCVYVQIHSFEQRDGNNFNSIWKKKLDPNECTMWKIVTEFRKRVNWCEMEDFVLQNTFSFSNPLI